MRESAQSCAIFLQARNRLIYSNSCSNPSRSFRPYLFSTHLRMMLQNFHFSQASDSATTTASMLITSSHHLQDSDLTVIPHQQDLLSHSTTFPPHVPRNAEGYTPIVDNPPPTPSSKDILPSEPLSSEKPFSTSIPQLLWSQEWLLTVCTTLLLYSPLVGLVGATWSGTSLNHQRSLFAVIWGSTPLVLQNTRSLPRWVVWLYGIMTVWQLSVYLLLFPLAGNSS